VTTPGSATRERALSVVTSSVSASEDFPLRTETKGVSSMASHWRAPADTADDRPRRRVPHPLLAPSLTISCEGCPVRGTGCDDCMVTTMLSWPAPRAYDEDDWELDADESRAVHLLSRAGLVSAPEAASARARRVDIGRRAVG